MIAKNIKRIFTTFVCAALVACTAFVCNAAGSKIQIEKLDNMTIQLPDDMLGITRDSKSTDKYFSVFGLDYDKTMSDFKSSDIFMQAMDNKATTTVTVTMTRNGDSEGIKNYKLLSEEKLYEVRDNFISQGEYISCTPDEAADLVWLMFDLNVSSGSDKIKAYQANTVYDGMSINVTIQHNGGNVTSADYQTLKSILSTVTFNSKADPNGDFTTYVYIGIIALVIILFIIVMIASKKAKNKNKKSRNEKILRELTDKYKSDNKPARKPQNEDIMSIYKAYDEMKNSDTEISSGRKDDDFDDYKDIDEEEVKVRIYEKPTVSDAEIDAIVNESKARFKNEGTDVEIIETKAEKLEPEEVIADEIEEAQEDLQTDEVVDTVAEDEPEKAENTEETVTSNESEEDFESDDYSDDEKYEDAAQSEISEADSEEDAAESTENSEDETQADEVTEVSAEEVDSADDDETDEDIENYEEDEEELRREAEKNTADDFDEGYDFFEEKPRRIVGIIDVDSSDLKNAVDYDVLSEEEKRAVEVETATDNDKTENFVEIASKAGNGIKNFFVHCGYFCTNVSRLVKRKYAAKKRKKAELERRERERMRRQQAAQRRDSNGLVKVHSATQKRPQSQNRNSQPNRKAPSRRPQQNNSRRK